MKIQGEIVEFGLSSEFGVEACGLRLDRTSDGSGDELLDIIIQYTDDVELQGDGPIFIESNDAAFWDSNIIVTSVDPRLCFTLTQKGKVTEFDLGTSGWKDDLRDILAVWKLFGSK